MLLRVDKDGNSEPIDTAYLFMDEWDVINDYPLIHMIVDTDTDEEVWHRTMAYFEGDYDPGSKILRQ